MLKRNGKSVDESRSASGCSVKGTGDCFAK